MRRKLSWAMFTLKKQKLLDGYLEPPHAVGQGFVVVVWRFETIRDGQWIALNIRCERKFRLQERANLRLASGYGCTTLSYRKRIGVWCWRRDSNPQSVEEGD